jgi:hypothetical protein
MKNPELSPGGSRSAGEPGAVTGRHGIRVKCSVILNINVFRQRIQGIFRISETIDYNPSIKAQASGQSPPR